MCVIVALKKGQNIPDDMLMNACYNNWHSYGLVIKVDNKLDIVRKVPESGEVDWKEVKDLLEDNVEYERFLHLRHTTAGKTDLNNCHPFDVYYNEKKGVHVVFMHNGTMYPFKSKKKVNGVEVDDDDGPSDTQNFVNQVLIPYTAATDFGNGHGDISHSLYKTLILKMWPSGSNRGLLISSKSGPFFIDSWKLVGPEGDQFWASNDDYFKEVKRGPEFSRREAAKKQKEAERKEASAIAVRDFRDFTNLPKHRFYSLSESLVGILNDWDVYDRPGAVSLAYASRDELEDLYSSKQDCVATMEWVFTDYAQLYEEYLDIEEKHTKASMVIAALKKEIKILKGEEKAA